MVDIELWYLFVVIEMKKSLIIIRLFYEQPFLIQEQICLW